MCSEDWNSSQSDQFCENSRKLVSGSEHPCHNIRSVMSMPAAPCVLDVAEVIPVEESKKTIEAENEISISIPITDVIEADQPAVSEINPQEPEALLAALAESLVQIEPSTFGMLPFPFADPKAEYAFQAQYVRAQPVILSHLPRTHARCYLNVS